MAEGDKKVPVLLAVAAGLTGLAFALTIFGLIGRAALKRTKLFGIITDAQTGRGIPGVDMTVYQDYDTETAIYEATTNAQGYYQILDMIPDVIALMVVYANGYQTYTNENIPIVEGNNELSFSMEAV